MEREQNYFNKTKSMTVFRDKKPQKQKVLEFLQNKPNNWYFVWEIMGSQTIGFISHKVDQHLSELVRAGEVESRRVGRYALYSLAEN